jgi:glyoxylase-like metal-dependent hydrolase (beta-lactamase superfamily II)
MPGPSLSPPFLLLAAAALAAGASDRTAGAPADRDEAARVFCASIEARNSNDFAKAIALRADDMRWIDSDGSTYRRNDEGTRKMLAWEHGSGARWSCRAVGYADGWLEAEVTENNRLYDALDVGAVVQRVRVRVEDGRIREGRTLAEWSTGRDYEEVNDRFKAWIRSLPAERRAGLFDGRSLVYDAETARLQLPLLQEWERMHPPARKLLAGALAPLGGAERLAGLDAWVVEGRGRENLSGELQGLAPSEPTWRTHEEKVAVVPSSGSVAWQRRTPRNDGSLRWRRFIFQPKTFGVVDFHAGYGAKRAREIPDSDRQALARRVPHLLLLEAATRAKRLVAAAPRTKDGTAADAVEATMEDGARLTLVFSRNPRALASAEYTAYLPGLGDSVVAWEWLGWKPDASLGLAPAGHRVTVGGTVFQEVTYDRYAAGSPDAAAMMEVPPDLSPADRASPTAAPGAAGPATGEVAPGVHVAEVRGFFIPFVELADFVVLFDVPASAPGLEAIPASGTSDCERVTEELVAAIARACPGKPVRFVVVSHHHSDHLGGIRAFAGPDVTVLAAPSHVPAVRRALASPHRLAPDRWSGDGREAGVEAVPDRRTITDGRRRIEVINVGENPHTGENLFVWLPEERLVFQGDLFYFEEGEPFPPSGRERMNHFFAGWLAAHGLSPKAVYGVHGQGAAPPEALALSRTAVPSP